MHWQTLTIPIPTDGSIQDAPGTAPLPFGVPSDIPRPLWPRKVIPYSTLFVTSAGPSASILHQADVALAGVWIRVARVLLDQRRDGRADAFKVMYRVFFALAAIYNALNIVWWNDPIARELYRVFFAGMPDAGAEGVSGNGEIFEAMYGSGSAAAGGINYNRDWYHAGSDFPAIIDPANAGTISGGAVAFYRALRPSTSPNEAIRFFQLMGLGLRAGDGTRLQYITPGNSGNGQTGYSGQAEYARNVVNDVWGFGMSQTEMGRGEYFFRDVMAYRATPGGDFVRENNIYTPVTSVSPRDDRTSRLPNDRVLLDDSAFWDSTNTSDRNAALADWHTVFAGDHDIASSFAQLVPWVNAWLTTLESRTPEQIILASRAYVIWTNLARERLNQSFFDDAATVNGSVANALSASDANLQTAARLAPALGTTIGAIAGGVGAPIGGVIGGAVALVLQGVDLITPGDVTGFRKDDLDHYKPLFERGWCSGDPALSDQLPVQVVPSPADPRVQAFLVADGNGFPQDITDALAAGVTGAVSGTRTLDLRTILPGRLRTTPQLSSVLLDVTTTLTAIGLTREDWRAMTTVQKSTRLIEGMDAGLIPNSNPDELMYLLDQYSAETPSEQGSSVPLVAKLAIAGAFVYATVELIK